VLGCKRRRPRQWRHRRQRGAGDGGSQQSNPFCNAGPANSSFSTVKGIALGFDDSLNPVGGPNWNTRIGESDFADLDPIRRACSDASDDICSANNMRRCAGGPLSGFTCRSNLDCGGGTCSSSPPGNFSALQCVVGGMPSGLACNSDSDCASGLCSGTNGLVQVVSVPSFHPDVNYPVDVCDQGATDVFPSNVPYLAYFGRCGDGSDAFANGCPIQSKVCTLSTPCRVPGSSTPKTSGQSYLCRQQSFHGLQGICFAGVPLDGTECRGANNWMRDIDGTLIGGSQPFLGASFRAHMSIPGPGCRRVDTTDQISCLVEVDPPSVGAP
jgi:hypothetical protein